MANAAYDKETVYAPNGEPHICSRLNALDLIRTAGFSWKPSKEVAVRVVEEAVADTLTDVVPAVETIDADADKPETIDPKVSDLSEVAAVLAGMETEAYLKSLSVENLRTMAEERYGERLRLNISPEKAVERIMALEAARVSAETTYEV